MALIVEDGSIVESADSYVSLADARTYATARGISISATDGTAEIQLRKAFDYIESQRDRFKGTKVDAEQSAQWPRTGVFIDGFEITSDSIPDLLKNAQVQLAAAVNSGLDLMPTADGGAFVVSERVGPLETKYSEAVSVSGVPIVRAAETLLAPLYRSGAALIVERA